MPSGRPSRPVRSCHSLIQEKRCRRPSAGWRIGHRRIPQFALRQAHREIGLLETQECSRQQCEMPQIVDFAVGEFSRHRIDKAKGTDDQPGFQLDRSAGIGTQFRPAFYIGHEAEIRVLGQIGNDHDILPGDDAVADRQIARAFRQLHPRLFGNMEPVLIDDVNGWICSHSSRGYQAGDHRDRSRIIPSPFQPNRGSC